MLHLEGRQVELGLDGIDDLVADVDVVADRLLLVVEIGKRDGRFADAHGDAARLLHFLERVGHDRRRDRATSDDCCDKAFGVHTLSPAWGCYRHINYARYCV